MRQTTTAVLPVKVPEARAPLATTPEELDFFGGRLAPIDLDAAEPMHCADCGERTPNTDLMFSERGRVCIDCHREDEVADVNLGPWSQAWPILAMIGGLVAIAITLPQVARIVLGLGPTGAIAWMVMNLLPATMGAFLAIAALRIFRDALTNPLDEELPFWERVLRTGTGGLALLASLACTLAFPIMALWPFV